MKGIPRDMRFYVRQADAHLQQANPASGTKYTILPTTTFVRLISTILKSTWTVQNNPMELHFTIDGEEWLAYTTAPVSTSIYAPSIPEITANMNLTTATTAASMNKSFLEEGKSVKVEMETTGGTVSELRGRVRYSRYI